MDKLFFSIGEAAQTIGESTSLVRYWTNEFDRHFKVRRSSRGDRKYTAEDIETLKQIHYLVNVKGMTLEGVDKALKENKGSVDRSVKVLESLKNIRDQLTEVKKAL
ncbi:MAG: MerR family transcriptional regulator [Bacteroidales bacterium]|jgi:DNA-binding transcriptional MerR regulator|nr:MerR family transcriptional regulator [Bacteroidales bacterium]